MFNTPKIALFFVSAAFSAVTLAAATAPAWAQGSAAAAVVVQQEPAQRIDLRSDAGRQAAYKVATLAARQECWAMLHGALGADMGGCVAVQRDVALRAMAIDLTVHRGGAQYAAAGTP